MSSKLRLVNSPSEPGIVALASSCKCARKEEASEGNNRGRKSWIEKLDGKRGQASERVFKDSSDSCYCEARDDDLEGTSYSIHTRS